MMKKPLALFVLLISTAMISACGSPPAAVSTLMQQVTQACQAGDENALKALIATDGVTKDQIDQHAGAWDSYFANKGTQYGYTYSGIRYVSIADAAHDKDILPETVTSAPGPQTLSGGFTLTPNLKVIGFLIISFKQGTGVPVGPIENVGIAPDGTAKISITVSRR